MARYPKNSVMLALEDWNNNSRSRKHLRSAFHKWDRNALVLCGTQYTRQQRLSHYLHGLRSNIATGI